LRVPDQSLEMAAGALVAGVDEAGRGPLAGPVVAGAVMFLGACPPALAELLDDSKRLKHAARQFAATALRDAARQGVLVFAVGAASVREIGARNILQATHIAMRRAVLRLGITPLCVLVDGNRAPALPMQVRCVVGGDGLSLSIAAASILAKTVRDGGMAKLARPWPQYGFGRHQGYGTSAHMAALARHGACPHHRRGFAPVEAALAARALVTHRC
jgi:ribonuclease HII